MRRPILIVVIGYIIGIIWGQYLNLSIVPLYIFITICLYIMKFFSSPKKFKVFSIHRYFKYLKIIINAKILLILFLSSFISYNIVISKNQKREILQNQFQNQSEFIQTGTIVSTQIIEEYKIRYIFEVKYSTFKNYRFYIDIKNNSNDLNTKSLAKLQNKNITNLEFGDKVKIKGEFIKPEKQRNYKGFDYNNYLKQKDILGTIKVQELEKINQNKSLKNNFINLVNNYVQSLKNKAYQILPEEIASLFIGIVFGDRSMIDEETVQNFNASSLSHILAVSGMHFTFLISGVIILLKDFLGRKKTYILGIVVILLYMVITGFSASIFRAGIMGIIMLISKLIYRKNDIWTSISISLLFMIIYNPFLIFDIGLQLSYCAMIGILLFQKMIYKYLMKKVLKIKKIRYHPKKLIMTFISKILEYISVTISAQILILPIMIYNFHSISVYFLFSNLLASFITEPLFIISWIFLFWIIICMPVAKFISILIIFFYKLLILFSKMGQLPYAQILVERPYLFFTIIYFLVFTLILIYNTLKTNKLRYATFQRFKNLKAWIIYKSKFQLKFQRKKFILVILIIFIFYNFSYQIFPQNLKIFFIDVGQGDSSLIITPQNKKILIDGGGSLSNFDVGEQTLIPYLLSRRIKKLDLLIISHFDIDHIRTDCLL